MLGYKNQKTGLPSQDVSVEVNAYRQNSPCFPFLFRFVRVGKKMAGYWDRIYRTRRGMDYS